MSTLPLTRLTRLPDTPGHLSSALVDAAGQDSIVARRKNIFDFASKELSATAFWAWVIDGEHSDDAALKAVNADRAMIRTCG